MLCSQLLQEPAAGSMAATTAFAVKVMLPHGHSLPLTEHSEGTSAGPFLNTGLLWQATLVPGPPIQPGVTFLRATRQPEAPPTQASFLPPPVTGVKPTVQTQGSPCVLLPPFYPLQTVPAHKSLAHLIPFRHLLLELLQTNHGSCFCISICIFLWN